MGALWPMGGEIREQRAEHNHRYSTDRGSYGTARKY